jgi:uncharacterized membrane protein
LQKKIKHIFLTGLAVTIPVGVTIYILFFLVNLMDSLFLVIPHAYHPDNLLGFHIPGLGVIFTVVLIFICGLATKSFIGRKAVTTGEEFLHKIPVVSSIYRATKQVVDAVFTDRGQSFKKVVLVEFPNKGTYVIGFFTGMVEGTFRDKLDGKWACVFVPTTPNPTSGYFVMVKENEMISMDISVEEAFTSVISCGIVQPGREK